MTAIADSATLQSAPSPRRAAAVQPPHAMDKIPVLLRLPNLDRSKSDESATNSDSTPNVQQPGASRDDTLTTKSNAPTQAFEQAPAGAVSASAVGKSGAGTSKVLALLWKVGIVAAAIGLVVLAYRIINGPRSGEASPQGQSYMVGTETNSADVGNSDNADSAAASTPEQTLPAPTIVTPVTTAPDSTGPAVFAPEKGGVGATVPLDAPAGINRATEERLPLGASSGEQDNWERENWNSPQSTESRPWIPPNHELGGENRNAYPSTDDPGNYDSQRPWAAGERSLQESAAPEEGDYRDTGNGAHYEYPQTNPQSWRDPSDWGSAGNARQGGPQNVQPMWHEEGRSAARLRPEIEQPPLRRNHEPNRSGLY